MYITTYTFSRSYKRGPKAGTTIQVHTFCATKSLTPRHERLRQDYPGSKTYGPNARVFTHFCLGLPLDKPIVSGRLIAQS